MAMAYRSRLSTFDPRARGNFPSIVLSNISPAFPVWALLDFTMSNSRLNLNQIGVWMNSPMISLTSHILASVISVAHSPLASYPMPIFLKKGWNGFQSLVARSPMFQMHHIPASCIWGISPLQKISFLTYHLGDGCVSRFAIVPDSTTTSWRCLVWFQMMEECCMLHIYSP